MTLKEALHILGLNPPVPRGEVKRAYRQLALKHHPDRNPGQDHSREAFILCTEAYNLLMESPGAWEAASPPSSAESPSFSSFEDIFDDLFGFTREGRILGYEEPEEVELTLYEFLNGVRNARRSLSAYEKCSSCAGSGSAKESHAAICTYCFGAGRIKTEVELKSLYKTCFKCGGRGRVVKKPCGVCQGYGRRKKDGLQEITLPAGLIPGEPYTFLSKNKRANSPLDVFIKPVLSSRSLFKVEKTDLVCEYPVSLTLLKEGGRLEFPGLRNPFSLEVLPDSKTGDVLVAKGEGLPFKGSKQGRGDLKIRLKGMEPPASTREQRVFCRKLNHELKNHAQNKFLNVFSRLFKA